MTEHDSSPAAQHPPAPLVVAASLVAVQGMALLMVAALEVAATTEERRSLGLSTAVFFTGYGVLLLVGAAALWRRAGWARGLVLLTQLITLGLAWTLRDQVAVALGLAVVALVALAGVVHPATTEALAHADAHADDRADGQE
ncbi:hypothetical protein [Nocardioides sambongensis]|uniref:hypothetical protein n=1 Tax=Nocardioides sambongensis TaxID=2589074 RepID=UPI0011275515|nr:hypothetical protein [Nocardioides sambongensis]